MSDFEKLVNSIMAECEKDGEPVTRAEAEEMATMELGAKDIKNYTKPPTRRKRAQEKERLTRIKSPYLKSCGVH